MEVKLDGRTIFMKENNSSTRYTNMQAMFQGRGQQGGFDGRGQQTASPMLTAIMSGGVGISGRELYKYR